MFGTLIYAVMLWSLSRRVSFAELATDDEVWAIAAYTSDKDDYASIVEAAQFACEFPNEANRRLHELHLADPGVRARAVEILGEVASASAWVEVELRGAPVYSRCADISGVERHVHSLLADLDVALKFRTSWYCNHEVPDEAYCEYVIVDVFAVDHANLRRVLARLEDAGLMPKARF
jgi:hypothetical protein